MTLVPFVEADEIGNRFLALLSRLDINPPPQSALEDELLSLTDLIDVMKNPNGATGARQVEVLRQAAGFHDFAAKTLSAEGLPEFGAFEPHLRLLGGKAQGFSTLIQNSKAMRPNDANRKLTELYVASLAIHLAREIELDSPEAAKGDNPDILFRYCGDPEERRWWALALKSVSGDSGQTYFERIKEAAAQIDADACPADIGMVVLNVKDTLDHDVLWETTHPTLDGAVKALHAQIHDRIQRAEFDRPKQEWDALFSGKVVRPILFMAHTLVRVKSPLSQEIPTAIKAMVAYCGNGEPHPLGHEIAVGLNHMMQVLLEGAPGGSGSLPR